MIRATALVVGLVALSGCAHPLTQLSRDASRAQPGDYVMPQRTTTRCTAAAGRLEAAAARLQIAIHYSPDVHGGRTDFTSQVWLHDSLRQDVCGRVETLAHELGHVLQPMRLRGLSGQVFADAVSYLIVRQHAGYDPAARYAPFLARYAPHLSVLDEYRAQIEVAAKVLMEARH